jgi:hypothetical protein
MAMDLLRLLFPAFFFPLDCRINLEAPVEIHSILIPDNIKKECAHQTHLKLEQKSK